MLKTLKSHLGKISTAGDAIRAYTETKRSLESIKSGKIPSALLDARKKEAQGKVLARNLSLQLDTYIMMRFDNGEVSERSERAL